MIGIIVRRLFLFPPQLVCIDERTNGLLTLQPGLQGAAIETTIGAEVLAALCQCRALLKQLADHPGQFHRFGVRDRGDMKGNKNFVVAIGNQMAKGMAKARKLCALNSHRANDMSLTNRTSRPISKSTGSSAAPILWRIRSRSPRLSIG